MVLAEQQKMKYGKIPLPLLLPEKHREEEPPGNLFNLITIRQKNLTKTETTVKTNLIRTLLCTILGILPLASCENIFDGEGDCSVRYSMRFIYDRNMAFADAFAHEVESVSLFVFDENGKFLQRIDRNGSEVKQQGHSLTLPLKAGRYTFVAWCGLDGKNRSFTATRLTPGVSTVQELTCRLTGTESREEGSPEVRELDDLYHGMATIELPDTYGEVPVDMYLTKNTNYIRIVLQQVSGKPLNPDDFLFTLTEDNGLMGFDNALQPDQCLNYRPWHISRGTADMGETAIRTQLNVLVAELSTARLLARQYENGETKYPQLTITRKTAESDGTYRKILSIPFVDFVLLVKGKYNENLSDQEYLDRQDEYSLTFFLDDEQNWLSTSIIVNSWKVVLSDVEL